jgi:very-short-patch-repair endonuclease
LEPINGRVDFAYVDEEIILEADSRRWHLISEAFDTDRRRDIAAQLAGWIVLRFTWKMITDEPDFVVNSVRNALSMRSGADSRDS